MNWTTHGGEGEGEENRTGRKGVGTAIFSSYSFFSCLSFVGEVTWERERGEGDKRVERKDPVAFAKR